MPGPVPQNPEIFHITHLRNLAKIVASGCLWSDSQRIARSIDSTNIGLLHIKQRRLNRPVTIGVGGTLGDYVPFNFCSRSVMLYPVHAGHNDYSGGQEEIVHLVSTVRAAIALGRPWAFTDRHADLGYAMYFNSFANLNEVDWNVMPLKYWAGSDDTKERRQAEFLVHESFAWSAVQSIGVQNAAVAAKVEALFPRGTPPVSVQPWWYY